MALVTANQFQLTPDLTQTISSGLNVANQFRAGQLQQAQQARQAQQDEIVGTANAAVKAQNLPDDVSKVNFLKQRSQEILDRGGDNSDTQEVLELFQSGQTDKANALLNSAVQTFTQQGFLKPLGGLATSGQKERTSLLADLESEDPNVRKSAEVSLGLTARAGTSASERIAANQELAAQIIAQKGAESEATETGKLKTQLKFKPQINKAVKLAEAEASARGEALTSFNRAKAALPGLKESISQLKDLSTIATSTFGGKLFDVAVKETGFGSTKGATAKAKFIAIVNNQVLPLLKPTFGSAFTEREGEALKATMGDPNGSVEEKMAQLDAFIAQKERDIETSQRELEVPLSIDEQSELEQLRAELNQ